MSQTPDPLDRPSKIHDRASDSRKAWTSPHLRILPVVSETRGGVTPEIFEGGGYGKTS